MKKAHGRISLHFSWCWTLRLSKECDPWETAGKQMETLLHTKGSQTTIFHGIWSRGKMFPEIKIKLILEHGGNSLARGVHLILVKYRMDKLPFLLFWFKRENNPCLLKEVVACFTPAARGHSWTKSSMERHSVQVLQQLWAATRLFGFRGKKVPRQLAAY